MTSCRLTKRTTLATSIVTSRDPSSRRVASTGVQYSQPRPRQMVPRRVIYGRRLVAGRIDSVVIGKIFVRVSARRRRPRVRGQEPWLPTRLWTRRLIARTAAFKQSAKALRRPSCARPDDSRRCEEDGRSRSIYDRSGFPRHSRATVARAWMAACKINRKLYDDYVRKTVTWPSRFHYYFDSVLQWT